MISALLVALREGLEAALIVGIVLVYLDRTGRRHLTRFVWAGVGAALASSFGVAVLLDRWQISQDGFEGLLMLLAAGFVVSMILWMNRVARHLKREIEERVESYSSRRGRAAGWGLGVFVFLLVLREGAELALILRAVELSTAGLEVAIGTALGLACAVAVGLFFFKGTLRISLGRFFRATSTILMIVAFQLALTGIHEMSEGMWIPSSRQEMALVGPIVRNEVFFFILILGVAVLLVLREWLGMAQGSAASGAENPAERRRSEWLERRQRRWLLATAGLCVAVLLALTAEFVYARAAAAPDPATPLAAQNGQVRVPVAELGDSNLHFYSADVNGTSIRFLVIRKPNGDYGAALDACQICGWAGYRQQGANVICRNCSAAIYIPSIGGPGGCNPVPVSSRLEGPDVVIDLSALSEAAQRVPR
jgi:high-affinity iron transporter